MLATALDEKDDARKIAILLNLVGQDAREKYKTFDLSTDDRKKYDKVVEEFKNYCTPKTNITLERHIFNTRVQESCESFSSFLTDLKKLSASCGLRELRDSLIKGRIICGINNPTLKSK